MRTGPIRIVIADGSPVVLAGARGALGADGGFEIAGETTNGSEVVTLVVRAGAEALLVDPGMPAAGGLQLLDRLRRVRPDVKVVVFADSGAPLDVESAFKHGACGYVLKRIVLGDLAASVRQAIEGTAFLAHGLHALDDESVLRAAGLSSREADILRGIARGLPNREIAHELWITEQTVKFHVTNIYRKLGISNRAEATRWTLANGVRIEGSSRL